MQQMKPPTRGTPQRLREIPGYRDLSKANKNLVKIIIGVVVFCFLLFVVSIVFGKQLAGVVVILLFAFPCLLPFIIFYAVVITIRIRRSQRGRLLYDNHQAERQDQRYTAQATRQVERAPDLVQAHNGPPFAILGAAIDGDLHNWLSGQWATLPEPELSKHGIILGGSGSGKTVSLLRIAYLAAKIYKYQVFYVDAKGDRGTAAQFISMMHAAQIGNIRMFPREPFNGWQGDGTAILNKLVAIEDFSEPYYKAVTKRVLTTICNAPDGPPRSSVQFFSRFTESLEKQLKLSRQEIKGVELRYAAFFDALVGKLDNGWNWENTAAAYILLDGLALQEEAASLGRFLLQDFANYAATRKPPEQKVLLIVDEYSALSSASTATNLFERLRSFNAAVLISSQSYGGLGERDEANRMLDAGNFLLIHRSADPELFIKRAGMMQRINESANYAGPSGSTGGARLEEVSSIHPDQVRRLNTGDAYIIAHGRYEKIHIAPAPLPSINEINQARQWIETPRSAPQIHAAATTTEPEPAAPETQINTKPESGPELL